MLNQDFLKEFVEKNKIKISEDWESEIKCIEFTEKPSPLRFPGGTAGIIYFFISSSKLYGFNLDVKKLIEIVPKTKHSRNCFHIKEIFRHPQNFLLENADLDLASNFLSKIKKEEKHEKETLFLITSGAFHLKQDFEIQTEDGKEKILGLTFNQNLVVEYIKKVCKKMFDEKIVSFKNFNLDSEYLTEVVLDNFQNHLWESIVKEYKGIPIYKVEFSNNGSFKLKDMGKV